MNPNTPTQPDDHEVRTCRIGPMSESEYALQTQEVQQAVQQVAAGEAHENEVEILAQSVSASIHAVQDEVLACARRFLLNGGLPLEQVSRSLDRLHEGNGQESLERTAQHVESVRRATIHKILFGLNLAMEETLINHARHGNRDPRRMIGVRYWIDEEGKMHVVSWDEGQGFDPTDVPDPRSDAALEKVNGRGRLLSAKFTDVFEDGAEGPSGKFGTSVHMAVQLSGLDARPEEPGDPAGPSMLDTYVRKAAQNLAAETPTNA